ncbi:MAG: hypothetical protein ACE1S7_06820, partial [Candidatus Tisiphia sp.]
SKTSCCLKSKNIVLCETKLINLTVSIGPVRMRSVLNQAAERNEERKQAEIEHLDCGAKVLEKVTRHMSVFTKGDLMRAVKYVSGHRQVN